MDVLDRELHRAEPELAPEDPLAAEAALVRTTTRELVGDFAPPRLASVRTDPHLVEAGKRELLQAQQRTLAGHERAIALHPHRARDVGLDRLAVLAELFVEREQRLFAFAERDGVEEPALQSELRR